MLNRESTITGDERGVQRQQMDETSQVSGEKTDDLISMTSEDQDIMFSATFMVKVGVCQTFQEGEYSRKHKNTLQEQMCMTSHVKKKLDNVTSVSVSSIQIEQNGNEAWTEGRPMGDGRRTGDMYEDGKGSFCKIADGCRVKAEDFDRKDVIVWIFSFMAMMVMMMASCIGQWTCTLDFQERYGMLQQKNQRMAADGLFYRMVRDNYSFVVYDGQFTHFQAFRNSDTDYVDICSDTRCC